MYNLKIKLKEKEVEAMNTHKESAIPDYTDWKQIPWNQLEEYVVKLQQRIYQAEIDGEKRKVRDLQRMLLNSKANLLISIKRVTQVNTGKRTAGVDGYLALTPEERIKLYHEMKKEEIKLHNPKPAYRTYITKKNGKLRPLGIPTIKDRIYQIIQIQIVNHAKLKTHLNHNGKQDLNPHLMDSDQSETRLMLLKESTQVLPQVKNNGYLKEILKGASTI